MTGAAAWVAVTATAPALTTGVYPLNPIGVFAGALVCAGAALLPDADHHNGTIANSVPGVGKAVTGAIGELAGGHRQGLHSFLAVIAVLALSSLLGLFQVDTEWFGVVPAGAGIATMALVAFAVRALKLARRSWLGPWFVGAVVAAGITVFAPTEVVWLPVAITLGFVVHLIGDALTTGGVPWLWPWKPKPPYWWNDIPVASSMWQRNGYFAAPVLGNTGSVREWLLGAVVTVYVIVVLVYEGFWAFGLDVTALLT